MYDCKVGNFDSYNTLLYIMHCLYINYVFHLCVWEQNVSKFQVSLLISCLSRPPDLMSAPLMNQKFF